MSASGGLDLRLPIGALFSVLGVIIAGYGLATRGDAAHYAPSGNLNINIWWGAAMLGFGVLMLLGARAGRLRTARGAPPAPRPGVPADS